MRSLIAAEPPFVVVVVHAHVIEIEILSPRRRNKRETPNGIVDNLKLRATNFYFRRRFVRFHSVKLIDELFNVV